MNTTRGGGSSVYSNADGAVNRNLPPGSCTTVHPAACFIAWCRLKNAPTLSTSVLPPRAQSSRWSQSQSRAGRRQPGNRHRISRATRYRFCSAVTNRRSTASTAPVIGSRNTLRHRPQRHLPLLRQGVGVRVRTRQLRLRIRDHPTQSTRFSDEFTRAESIRLPPIHVAHLAPIRCFDLPRDYAGPPTSTPGKAPTGREIDNLLPGKHTRAEPPLFSMLEHARRDEAAVAERGTSGPLRMAPTAKRRS